MIQKELLGIGNIKISETERKYVESLQRMKELYFWDVITEGHIKKGIF